MDLDTQLQYTVFVHETDSDNHTRVYTGRITGAPTATGGEPVKNPVAVGELFTAIRSNKRVSVVVPKGQPKAVHMLAKAPKNKPTFYVEIELWRKQERQGPYNRYTCEQEVSNIELNKVELLELVALKESETYVANFKVTGVAVTRHKPEAVCKVWTKKEGSSG